MYTNVERFLHCKRFSIVNVGDALTTIFSINHSFTYPEHPEYPHSVVAHLLALSCGSLSVPLLEDLVMSCCKSGWCPYRADASHYEKICIKKIVDTIDNYEKKNH